MKGDCASGRFEASGSIRGLTCFLRFRCLSQVDLFNEECQALHGLCAEWSAQGCKMKRRVDAFEKAARRAGFARVLSLFCFMIAVAICRRRCLVPNAAECVLVETQQALFGVRFFWTYDSCPDPAMSKSMFGPHPRGPKARSMSAICAHVGPASCNKLLIFDSRDLPVC